MGVDPMVFLNRLKANRIEPDDPEPDITGSNPLHQGRDSHRPPSLLRRHSSKSHAFVNSASNQSPSDAHSSILCSPFLRRPVFRNSISISKSSRMLPVSSALSAEGAVSEAMTFIQLSPATWKSALFSNLLIFVAGSPILVAGLSVSGIGAAFLLGTLTWRAFGPSGFLLVATYFIIGTAATKVKMAQKEAQGVAEKRKGRRGPRSVVGSSAAGCLCAFLSIYGVGGATFTHLWRLGFVASFCTKLSDTVSSEIGKAYGKTTYLITTFKVVPPGTEGGVSLEGTAAGVLASIFLAITSYLLGEVKAPEAVICVVAAQIANFGESIIGAALQDKKGFQWLNNDAVNVINITTGSILAVLMQHVILQNLH